MRRFSLAIAVLALAGCKDKTSSSPDQTDKTSAERAESESELEAPVRPELAVGRQFPDIAFRRAGGGDPVRISDFRGQKVVLHVFASW